MQIGSWLSLILRRAQDLILSFFEHLTRESLAIALIDYQLLLLDWRSCSLPPCFLYIHSVRSTPSYDRPDWRDDYAAELLHLAVEQQ